MRLRLKQCVTVLALYAVALHLTLFGLAPFAANAAPTADPFSVICHSQAAAATDEAPADPGLLPGHACDHCNLCSAAAPPSPPDVALGAPMAPARVLHLLQPISAAARAGLASDPKRARGPPLFA